MTKPLRFLQRNAKITIYINILKKSLVLNWVCEIEHILPCSSKYSIKVIIFISRLQPESVIQKIFG